ncbi:MAG: alpha/beta fold hydrolase [Candidatus Eremiobacteraeota bacterium]|nr:alpha/beta fold hydrolase [Candidatus Eremiobacteraeota bacterium]
MPVDLLVARARNNDITVLRYGPRRPRGVTIVAGHGYSSSKHNLDSLCSFLSAQGFSIFSLDFPGHKLGASGGKLRGLEDCVDAMEAVVDIAQTIDDQPLYVMGHSMGAMTALFTAARNPRLKGVIAIGTGYGRPSALAALKAAGATDFRASYVDGVDLSALVADVGPWYERYLPQLAGRPCLYVAATKDAMISMTSTRELYDRAPEPKDFATVESDHTYAAENSRTEVLQWLNKLHPRA